jgi:hypothetical protein
VEPAVGGGVVARERDHHVDLQREAGGVVVQPGGDAPDHARLLQAPDAIQRRGRGQADDPSELDVRAVGVHLQLVQESDVNFVKLECHFAKYCSAIRAKSQILVEEWRESPIIWWWQSIGEQALKPASSRSPWPARCGA